MKNKPSKPAFNNTPEHQALVDQALQNYLKIHELLPTSPTRIPDWRWKLVQVMADNSFLKKYLRQDQGLKMAMQLYKYLQYLDSIGPRQPRKKPLPEGVMEAYALYSRPLRSQAELKARLLAEEPMPIIAKKINSTEAAITWFEHLFFNISDRLQASSYISNNITLLESTHRYHPLFLAAFLMEVGYRLGPVAIDLILELQDRILEPITPSDYLPTDDPQETLLRLVKMLIEVRSTFPSPDIPQPLLDIRGLTELDHREQQTKQLTKQIQETQSLYTPLADIGLDYDDITGEQDFYLQDLFSGTDQVTAQKVAI